MQTKPYGKLYQTGYKGRLSDGSWVLFPTEQEYLDYIAFHPQDDKEESEDDKKLD